MEVAGDPKKQLLPGFHLHALLHDIENGVGIFDQFFIVGLVARITAGNILRRHEYIFFKIVARLYDLVLLRILICNTVSKLDARQPDRVHVQFLDQLPVQHHHGDEHGRHLLGYAQLLGYVLQGTHDHVLVPAHKLFPGLRVVCAAPVLEDQVGKVVAHEDHRPDLPVLHVHAPEIDQVLADQLVHKHVIMDGLAIESAEPFTDPEGAEQDVLRGDEGILLKEGDLDASTAHIDDRRPLGNEILEFLPPGCNGFIPEETLLGIGQHIHINPGGLIDMVHYEKAVVRFAESGFCAGPEIADAEFAHDAPVILEDCRQFIEPVHRDFV